MYKSRGHMLEFPKYDVFIPFKKIDFIQKNSVDLDKMLHFAAFHLGIHCLLKCPSTCFLYTNGESFALT